MGVSKRAAQYVPVVARIELDKLSKATLMELLWDFALRTMGEDSDERAYKEIRTVNDILGINNGTRIVKLAPDFETVARRILTTLNTSYMTPERAKATREYYEQFIAQTDQ